MITSTTDMSKRGGCLTFFLVFYLISTAVSLLIIFVLPRDDQMSYGQAVIVVPRWLVPLMIASTIYGLLAVYGVWTWKKWGVYLVIFDIATSAFIIFPLIPMSGFAYSLLAVVVMVIVEYVILWYVLKDKWTYFQSKGFAVGPGRTISHRVTKGDPTIDHEDQTEGRSQSS